MFYDAPTPLSPAQRIRFSGMWEEPASQRVAAAAQHLRSSRPGHVVTSTTAGASAPNSPAQRIKQNRTRSRSAARTRPSSASATRCRPPPVELPMEEPALEESSFGALAPWDRTAKSDDLGFAFSQLLDTSQKLEKADRRPPVLSPSPPRCQSGQQHCDYQGYTLSLIHI
eukprot:TRINITY_DN36209_c0_g1_i3.p2 TRINITY_DN36209_c0_g1~~TRINITY_DN36209_c0_g1_i3.p2  ORF type:complete len:170 (+),score=31.37 TRINITY_DN36209_c0_g1_i3:262-771(+)